MRLSDRMLRLLDGMPPGSSITLRVETLQEWLNEAGEGVTPDRPAPADLTVAQIAERFDRAPQTVRDWIKSGKLTAYRFAGREWRVPAAALAAFEEAQRGGPSDTDQSEGTVDLGAWRKVQSVT